MTAPKEMFKMKRHWGFLAVLLGALGGQAVAQTPGMLTFQGLIKDAGGQPVTGLVDLEFRIYDAATAGNLLDMDGDGLIENVLGQDAKQLLNVTATNGIATAKFGPVHPRAFNGAARWLEVRVEGSPL